MFGQIATNQKPLLGILPDFTNPSARGAVAAWPCLEGLGTHTNDFFPGGSHGTFTNGPTWGPGDPLADRPLNLAGDDDFVDCGSAASLSLSTAASYSIWFNPASIAAYEVLMSKFDDDGSFNGIGFWFNADTLYFTVYQYNSRFASIPFVVSTSLNQWWHAVGTFDGFNVRIFLNGVEGTAGTSEFSIPATTKSLNLGRAAVANYFHGQIESAAVHDRPLAPSEASYLYTHPNDIITPALRVYPAVVAVRNRGIRTGGRMGGSRGIMTGGRL